MPYLTEQSVIIFKIDSLKHRNSAPAHFCLEKMGAYAGGNYEGMRNIRQKVLRMCKSRISSEKEQILKIVNRQATK